VIFQVLDPMTQKNKMTAVEWLSKELESYGDPQFCKIEWEQLDSLIDQSKEIEKQQITDAYRFGIQDEYVIGAEQYYNETFKKTEQ
jgi:hypothetical protein